MKSARRRWRSTSCTATRSILPTACSCSSAPCAKPRCVTRCTRLSWPSRWKTNRARRCTCTRASSTRKPAATCSPAADGEADFAFHGYIAGLQKYTPALMPIFAPYINSYRRLSRFMAAPINVAWGYDNRTVGFRIPHSEPGCAPHREPHSGRGLQSVSGDRRDACRRLSRHDAASGTDRAAGSATVTRWLTSCRAISKKA